MASRRHRKRCLRASAAGRLAQAAEPEAPDLLVDHVERGRRPPAPERHHAVGPAVDAEQRAVEPRDPRRRIANPQAAVGTPTWRAPHCEESDHMSSPELDACALRLEWAEVEVPRPRTAVAAQPVARPPGGVHLRGGRPETEIAKAFAGRNDSGFRRRSSCACTDKQGRGGDEKRSHRIASCRSSTYWRGLALRVTVTVTVTVTVRGRKCAKVRTAGCQMRDWG
jgi:hypothetical protein